MAVAQKALNGDFGPLAGWQRIGYQKIADGKAVKRVAWVTYYLTGEPGVGTRTASGQRVKEGRTAAMLDVPFGTCVLVSLPQGYTLRQVWDRGSRANIRRARKRGACTWIDLYMRDRRKRNATHVRPVWIVR